MNQKIQKLAVQEDAARDAQWAVEKRYEELEEEIKKKDYLITNKDKKKRI